MGQYQLAAYRLLLPLRVEPRLIQLKNHFDLGGDVAAAQAATTEAFNVIGANLRITKEYITPDEILDAIREPLAEFYGEVFTIHARQYEAKG